MNAFVNKHNMRVCFGTLLLLIAASLTWGCADDPIYNPDSYPADGTLHMSLSFEPLCGMSTTTRAPGDAIKAMESLAIVFFDKDGKLVKVINTGTLDSDGKITQGDSEILDWRLDPAGNTGSPALSDEDKVNKGEQWEANTALATFRLSNIPDGSYKIYAVANMGIITDEMAATEDLLKAYRLIWNEENIGRNNQMFGYFTSAATGDDDYRPGDFDAPVIQVSDRTPKLSAWVRRAASKVTIAYDSHLLKQDVWIYINKVTIRDIPKTCLLGETNTPESMEDLIREGGSIYYDNNGIVPADKASADHNDWLILTNKLKEPVGSGHSETDEALFFYENMQGDFEGQDHYDKRQKKDYLGVLVDPGDPDYKDEREYGTYIEVEAFYNSQNVENYGSGKIIYRFMLGKNITYNYNAERNHHYKLTLVFNGWANQADWHIEYTAEDPSIQTPEEFYMPYLYNQCSYLPFKLNGDVQSLHVEIIENGWAPVSPTTHEVPSTSEFTWNEAAYQMFGPKQNQYPQLGFLALAVPNNEGEPAKNVIDNKDYRDHSAVDDLKELYEEEYEADGYKYSQCDRWYNVESGTHQPGNNQYTITPSDQGKSYTVQIPLWTRNKTMIMNSGYTGNNPYEAFERKAVIRITAVFKKDDGTTEELYKDVPIYQVRRIVNPKGIWRSRSDNKDFFVHLMTLNSPDDPKYTPLESDGSWTATIEDGDKTFCYLTDLSGVSHDVIEGDTGDEIRFYVKFSDETFSEGTTKGCVVNIKYNGTSCTHKILVRRGYDTPVALVDGGAKWSSFNLYAVAPRSNGQTDNTSLFTLDAEVTCNPLAIGSLFKRRNYTHAVLIDNNNTYGPLVPLDGKILKVKAMGGEVEEMTWDEIQAYRIDPAEAIRESYKWATFQATPPGASSPTTYRVPGYDDYKALDDAEYAVGVVYADGASKTVDTFDAYGYEDSTNTLKENPNGVRGYIVYNKETGAQVFFPLGKYGMARRTQWNLSNNNQRGYLRYSDAREVLSGETNLWRPIPYDLVNCPGAVYWINLPQANGHPDGYCGGWDLNYFSLDFSSYTNNNRQDACPVKLVVNE